MNKVSCGQIFHYEGATKIWEVHTIVIGDIWVKVFESEALDNCWVIALAYKTAGYKVCANLDAS